MRAPRIATSAPAPVVTYTGGGGFVGPRRVATPPRPAPGPVVTVMDARGRPTVIPYYDPSRIFKDIKVVADMRQQGTERGETQTGDNGTLGPGGIAPPRIALPGAPGTPGAPGKNALIPLALVAAFLLFGG